MAVIVTGEGIEQLLGAPRLTSGTGEAQAEATKQLLQTWGIASKTVGKAYDTTAANSGSKKDTSVRLPVLLGKEDMLDIGCRHHVHELVLGAAFLDLLGDSKDAKLPIFDKLTSAWNSLDKGKHLYYNTKRFT